MAAADKRPASAPRRRPTMSLGFIMDQFLVSQDRFKISIDQHPFDPRDSVTRRQTSGIDTLRKPGYVHRRDLPQLGTNDKIRPRELFLRPRFALDRDRLIQ